MIFLLWANLALGVFVAVVVVLLCRRFETFLSVMAQRGAEVVEEEEARHQRRSKAAKEGWERRRDVRSRLTLVDTPVTGTTNPTLKLNQQYQDEP